MKMLQRELLEQSKRTPRTPTLEQRKPETGRGWMRSTDTVKNDDACIVAFLSNDCFFLFQLLSDLLDRRYTVISIYSLKFRFQSACCLYMGKKKQPIFSHDRLLFSGFCKHLTRPFLNSSSNCPEKEKSTHGYSDSSRLVRKSSGSRSSRKSNTNASLNVTENGKSNNGYSSRLRSSRKSDSNSSANISGVEYGLDP